MSTDRPGASHAGGRRAGAPRTRADRLAPWVRAIVAPAWAAWERSPYLRVARRLAREERISPDERRARQVRRLRQLLEHAGARSPWYRRLFAEAGFDPRSVRDLDDLAALPALTKDDLRRHLHEIVVPGAEAAGASWRRTSGSTGSPVSVLVDEASGQWKRGVTLYRDEWTSWRLGERRAMVWGNPPVPANWRQRLRAALLERAVYLDTLRMDGTAIAVFCRELARRPATLLFGHAHSLFLLAEEVARRGLPIPRPRAVLSTAMVLHPHERARVEEVFGAPVFDRFGCEEASLVASECEVHEGLHLNTDTLVVELVDAEGRPTTGEGRILLTDLTNRACPLVRYEVGDVGGPLLDEPCPCGRTYPRIRYVLGRVADYLVTPAGELVSGISLTENLANLLPAALQVQLVQETPRRLRVRIRPERPLGPAEKEEIHRLVARRFGPGMETLIEEVEKIDPEPSGKYRFAIRRFPLPGGRA